MKSFVTGLIVVAALAVAVVLWRRTTPEPARAKLISLSTERTPNGPLSPPPQGGSNLAPTKDIHKTTRALIDRKREQIERIKRDYDEHALRLGAEFNASVDTYPGGLNGYLRELALLERERRRDFAEFLTPQELEDLELRETPAGKAVQQGLGETAATEEQRRAVFRLRREFDDKYALSFDLTPAALLAREMDRQAVQEEILAALGPELFSSWVRVEGPEFENVQQFLAEQGLAPQKAVEVWRVRNEFTRANLQLATSSASPEEAAARRAAIAQTTRTRLEAIIGVGAVQAGASGSLGSWIRQVAPPP